MAARQQGCRSGQSVVDVTCRKYVSAIASSSSEASMRSVACLAVLMLMVLGAKPARAVEPLLTLDLGGVARHFTVAELLARPDAAEMVIPNDPSYRRAARYRAVPLLPLLADLPQGPFDTLEARATDGFVAQIPMSLVRRGAEGGAA